MVWSQTPILPSIQKHELNKRLLCISAQELGLFEQQKMDQHPFFFSFCLNVSLWIPVCTFLFLHTLIKVTFQMLRTHMQLVTTEVAAQMTMLFQRRKAPVGSQQQSDTHIQTQITHESFTNQRLACREAAATIPQSITGLLGWCHKATNFTSTEVRQIRVERGSQLEGTAAQKSSTLWCLDKAGPS